MLAKTSTPLENYPQRFQQLYLLSKEFSKENHFNLDEVFEQAVKYHDPQHSEEKIKQYLKSYRFQSVSSAISRSCEAYYNVWLLFGETGQGKSAFVNAICESQEAEEGLGMNSVTTNIGLHRCRKHQVIIVDTPGLFDTREIENNEIADQIIKTVQNELKQNAHVKAIFLVWNPNFTMRFRLDKILSTLERALGRTAINSVVFLVNKVSDQWNQNYENSYQQLVNELKVKRLFNPVFPVDLKRMNQGDVDKLKNLAQEVRPFKEKDFENHRIMVYYNKFLEVQKIDEQKNRQRKEIEEEKAKEWEEKLKISQMRMKTENAEFKRKIEQQHQEELAMQREQSEQRLREEQERTRRAEQRRQEEAKPKRSFLEGITLREVADAGLSILSFISQMNSISQTSPPRNVLTHPSVASLPLESSRDLFQRSKRSHEKSMVVVHPNVSPQPRKERHLNGS